AVERVVSRKVLIHDDIHSTRRAACARRVVQKCALVTLKNRANTRQLSENPQASDSIIRQWDRQVQVFAANWRLGGTNWRHKGVQHRAIVAVPTAQVCNSLHPRPALRAGKSHAHVSVVTLDN